MPENGTKVLYETPVKERVAKATELMTAPGLGDGEKKTWHDLSLIFLISHSNHTKLLYYVTYVYSLASIVAPIAAVGFSPQCFVRAISLGHLFVYHLKAAYTFTLEISFIHARHLETAAESLNTHHIYLWTYIFLFHFASLLFLGYLIIIFFPSTT